MGNKEKLTSHNDAITTGLEDNEAVLSYLNGGVLEQQGTWDAPSGSELNGRWSREWILSCYLDLTDAMIQHLGGYENEQPDFVPDEVLFLDKSARPVAWLVDSLWEVMADKGAKKPHLGFIHIDRKDWWSRVKLPLVGEENRDPFEFNIKDVSEDAINAIRAKFVIGDLTPDNYGNEVWKLPTTLDGKNVLIVDEIRSSGATTHMATELLSCAVPSATFKSVYFWSTPYNEGKSVEIDNKDGTRSVQRRMYNIPVWYDKHKPDGREVSDPSSGVMDRLYRENPTQENLKRRIAWFVESVTPEDVGADVDERTKRLKRDIAVLSYLSINDFMMAKSDTRTGMIMEFLRNKQGASSAGKSSMTLLREHTRRIKKKQGERTFPLVEKKRS